MFLFQTPFAVLTLCVVAVSLHISTGSQEQPSVTATTASPKHVVARWLELHCAGKRDEAAGLTTGSPDHRAGYSLPTQRNAVTDFETGVRAERSLGNDRVAAVITGPLNKKEQSEDVLLFWLVRTQGAWRIRKSGPIDRQLAEERLRGFLEADDVRWHVELDDIQGRWESGPSIPPGFEFVACGSQIRLGKDLHYRLSAWGPAGPLTIEEEGDVIDGKWQLTNGKISLAHQAQAFECRVAWISENEMVLESLNSKGEVTGRTHYERAEEALDGE